MKNTKVLDPSLVFDTIKAMLPPAERSLIVLDPNKMTHLQEFTVTEYCAGEHFVPEKDAPWSITYQTPNTVGLVTARQSPSLKGAHDRDCRALRHLMRVSVR